MIWKEIESNDKLKEPQPESAESNLVIFVLLMCCQGHKQDWFTQEYELERLFKGAINTFLRCA